jgi:spoIIIJ-associated protein
VVGEALVAALSDALDVDEDRLKVTVTLDDAPVAADRLPLQLDVTAPTADEPTTDAAPDEDEDTDEDAQEDVRDDADDARPAAAPAARDRAGRDDAGPAPVSSEDLDEEAEAAADLLEGLLDAMDLPGDLRISLQEAHAEVEVVGLEEGVLIGRRGQTLDAIQELVRTAMQRRFERRSRVLVDVDGYRARRLEKLLERADEAVAEVLASGEPQRLEPMDAIERRLVHQRVAETDGVMSTSHGREPARRIVIEPSDD